MKVYKKTIVYMLFLCLISLCISSIFEFKWYPDKVGKILADNGHAAFYQNILMGILTSGLLVLIPAIVAFVSEKKKYYIAMLRTSGYALDAALEFTRVMARNSQDKDAVKFLHGVFSSRRSELIALFSDFTYFFRINRKDKLVESIVVQITKVNMLFDELFHLSRKVEEKTMSVEDYTQYFNGFRSELEQNYCKEFEEYKHMLDKEIKGLIDDRTLIKYI